MLLALIAWLDLPSRMRRGYFILLLFSHYRTLRLWEDRFANDSVSLMTTTSGAIILKGHSVNSPPPGLVLLFQDYGRSLMPWRRVIANVCFGLELKRQRVQFREKEVKKRAEKYLDAVGLLQFKNYYPWQLSGGMQQRVAIARALACEPSLLLMDEPFGSLDAQTRAELEDQLLQIWERFRQTIIFVTHDIDEGVYLSDRVIVLTASPAEISKEFHIDLPRPRSQIETRSDPNFLRIRNAIHKMILQNGSEKGVLINSTQPTQQSTNPALCNSTAVTTNPCMPSHI